MPDESRPAFLQPGDVFRFPFAAIPKASFGHIADPATGRLVLDRSRVLFGQGSTMGYRWTETRPDGFSRHHEVTLDRRIDDPGLLLAEWMVEHAGPGGGGSDGRGGYHEDGWGVVARRLREDGTYDPAGTVATFRQSGGFIDRIDGVAAHRTMQMMFA